MAVPKRRRRRRALPPLPKPRTATVTPYRLISYKDACFFHYLASFH